MTDRGESSGILSGTLFTGLGKSMVVFLGLASFLISARWLTTEELGGFTIIQVAAVFIANFSDFGINTALTKYLAQDENADSRTNLIFICFFFRLLTLLFAVLIAFLLHRVLFSLFGSSFYLDLLPYLPVLVFLEGFSKFYNATLEGLFRFKAIGILDIITSILSFGLMILFLVWLDMGLVGRFLVRILVLLIPLTIMVMLQPIRKAQTTSFTPIKGILRFGFPLYINQVLSFVFLRADTFIIGILLGPAEIALYEIARKIPESLEMIYDAFRRVYFPKVSRLLAHGKKIRSALILNSSLRLLTFVTSFGALVSFFWGKELINLLFSNKYEESAIVFAVIMVGLVTLVVDYTLGFTIVAAGDSDKPMLINIVRTGINFLGYFTLIKPLGVIGAALAAIIGTVVVNPLNIYFLRKRNIPVKVSTYLKPFLLMLAILLSAWLMPWKNSGIEIGLVIVFLIASWWLSIIGREDLDSIKDIIGHLIRRKKFTDQTNQPS